MAAVGEGVGTMLSRLPFCLPLSDIFRKQTYSNRNECRFGVSSRPVDPTSGSFLPTVVLLVLLLVPPVLHLFIPFLFVFSALPRSIPLLYTALSEFARVRLLRAEITFGYSLAPRQPGLGL